MNGVESIACTRNFQYIFFVSFSELHYHLIHRPSIFVVGWWFVVQTEEVSKLHTTNCVSRIIIHSICQGYKLHRSHQRQNFNPTAMSILFVAQSDKDSISNQKMGMMSCRLVLGTAIQINENLLLHIKTYLPLTAIKSALWANVYIQKDPYILCQIQ